MLIVPLGMAPGDADMKLDIMGAPPEVKGL
jgi:hypothetical protein